MEITLGAFLRKIGGECVRVVDKHGALLYDADKNAIRAYHGEWLDTEVTDIEAIGKNRFSVRINLLEV